MFQTNWAFFYSSITWHSSFSITFTYLYTSGIYSFKLCEISHLKFFKLPSSVDQVPIVKRPGRGINHPSPSSAKVKVRVELYLYFPSGPSWPLLRWTSSVEIFWSVKLQCLKYCIHCFKFNVHICNTFTQVMQTFHVTINHTTILNWSMSFSAFICFWCPVSNLKSASNRVWDNFYEYMYLKS